MIQLLSPYRVYRLPTILFCTEQLLYSLTHNNFQLVSIRILSGKPSPFFWNQIPSGILKIFFAINRANLFSSLENLHPDLLVLPDSDLRNRFRIFPSVPGVSGSVQNSPKTINCQNNAFQIYSQAQTQTKHNFSQVSF